MRKRRERHADMTEEEWEAAMMRRRLEEIERKARGTAEVDVAEVFSPPRVGK